MGDAHDIVFFCDSLFLLCVHSSKCNGSLIESFESTKTGKHCFTGVAPGRPEVDNRQWVGIDKVIKSSVVKGFNMLWPVLWG